MPSNELLGLGLIGCGDFGDFCLGAFSGLPGLRIAAVADVYRPAADRLAAKFDVPALGDPAELIARSDVQIVHVATPPSLHHALVMAAIAAGKHVLCEKPLATRVADAEEMLAAASAAGTIAPVNFVLRHNAVTDAVKAVIDSGALGKVLRAQLTNCAGDTKLGPDHWFWDRNVSGGIFIEHGVHFFDLYRHWLGDGEILDSHTETRLSAARAGQLGAGGGMSLGAPPAAEADPVEQPRLRSGQEDRVMCTIVYAGGAVACHYHGFDQVSLMDRTDHRLVCELGDVRVDGWIPLSLEIHAVVNDETQAQLAVCCAGAEIQTLQAYDGLDSRILGRGVQRDVTRRIRLNWMPSADKQAIYADSVRALLADQLAFVRDASHPRRVTEANGLAALQLAQRAVQLARDRPRE